jgi:hypothetical protein
MRTLRLSLVGTVILVLLGGVGSAVAAQEADRSVYVTGSMLCGDGARIVHEDDGVELHLFPGSCTVTMSDPRLSGTHVYDTQQFCLKETEDHVCMAWGTSEITGPDGTWVGTFGWVEDPSRTMLPGWGVVEGTGDYDGWTFWWHNPDLLDGSSVFSGIVYEGPPPPWGKTLPLTPAE